MIIGVLIILHVLVCVFGAITPVVNYPGTALQYRQESECCCYQKSGCVILFGTGRAMLERLQHPRLLFHEDKSTKAQNSTWQRRIKSFSNMRRYPSLHQEWAMFPQRLSPEFKSEWIGRRH
ncbi:hypothetical protein C8034_v009578 [Colletotrichum sidae]|uniref:Secreted protein n=1 Tax=Colletotrichum sidae TaxID=1347389 RepID=A0A4R8TM20_9PEZI|nr:hypothetical protein C8034_v009578 [Colletotrichum sidae]